jgi:uncharacterized protein with PQ loop repeat
MKDIISAIFGAGLIINAVLFVPQAWHLWKAKRADGVSIPSFLGFLRNPAGRCAGRLLSAR